MMIKYCDAEIKKYDVQNRTYIYLKLPRIQKDRFLTDLENMLKYEQICKDFNNISSDQALT